MSKSQKALLIFALGPVWIFFAVFVLQLLSVLIIQKLSPLVTITAFLSAALLPTVIFKEQSFKFTAFSILGPLLLITSCFYISSSIYDTSFDGQTYHQLAVSYLANGWNFFLSTDPPGNIQLEYVLPLHHYPKFPWLVEASLFQISGDLEGAKAINLVLAICSGLLAYLAAQKLNYSKLNSILFASALSLNPVVICQLWTFYVDGLMASMTLFFFAALSIYFNTGKNLWAHITGIALILLLQIKFTAVVIIGSFFVVLFSGAIRKSSDAVPVLKLLLGYLALGALVVGWHPYVMNFIATGNPIYPVAGYSPLGKTPPPKDWPIFPLVQGQQPPSIAGQPGPIKTLLSVSSRTADPLVSDGEFQFFWHSRPADFLRFVTPDLRLGAFGLIYPVVLLISLATLFPIRPGKEKNKMLFACVVIFLSALLNPESWWCRYSPQLWMLPLLLAASSRRERLFIGICLLMILNSATIFFVDTAAAFSNSRDVTDTLRNLKVYSNGSLPGSVGNFYANELRLKKLNIRLTPPDSCQNRIYIPNSFSFVCPSK